MSAPETTPADDKPVPAANDKPVPAANDKPLIAVNDNTAPPPRQRLGAPQEQRAARTACRLWMSSRVVQRLLVRQRPELRRRPF